MPSTAEQDWLLGFSDPARGPGWNPRASRAARWRLGRTRRLLRLLGDPDRDLTCVLIAGTKGKGSTAACLASILRAAGIPAGLFTSPHLQEIRERVRIDGALLPPARFDARIRALRRPVAALRRAAPTAGEPTTFELLLVLALRAFADGGCRVAVLEVGLGGAQDATNAVDPAVSIITGIGYDHTQILGRTLGAIATEKAGILRRGRPALIAEQRPAAAAALRRACRESGAECRTIAPTAVALPLLHGVHQRHNAAVAAEAARLVGVTPAAIARGLAAAWWPGRFEVVREAPAVVLDGAHNGSSAQALAGALRLRYPRRRIHLVLGLNADKDARASIAPLLALARQVTVTASGASRARPASELAGTCHALGSGPVLIAPDVAQALASATARARPSDVICVTGSLALVGEARTALGLRPPEQLWPAPRPSGAYTVSRRSARNGSP
ncbi:MAG: folylpolyglutamate synthase/dihydrofolate synthase family protein [Candidatus Limnocylindrales bacterium]